MEKSKLSLIEFLLFVSPKPLTLVQLKNIIGDIKTEEISYAIGWLKENLYNSGRALQIRELSEGFKICTRPEFSPWLTRLSHFQTRPRLSQAALEVLAIIVYKQPVTKNEIDEIRGVNSGPLTRNLLKQKLIRIAGKKDCPGRPILYGIGKGFLDYFGLKDLKELPREEELKELISYEEKERKLC